MAVEKLKDININVKLYNLYSCTGKVASFNKFNTTEVTGSGGGGGGRIDTDYFLGTSGKIKINPIKIESETTIYDQLILVDEDSQEYDFQLKNLNLNCREGNKISVAQAIKQGGQNVNNIMIHNHNTKTTIFDIKTLSYWLRPIWLWAFVALPIGILVIPFFIGVFSGNIWLLLLSFFVSLFATPRVYAGMREIIGESKAIKFKNSSEVKRIIDYIETT